MNALLKNVIAQTARSIPVDEELLNHWVQHHQDLPMEITLSFLHLAQKHHLDPLADEIAFMKHPEGQYQIYITIDGWAKLMELHPKFAGINLRESTELQDDVPIWMECAIYRNDRVLPIVIKEYLVEVKTNHPSWQQMPRRMLRHRVIQQCARLAFGIGASEMLFPIKKMEVINTETTQAKESHSRLISRSQFLKEKIASV
jgi:hypothetical protein